jgi:hypothetical protein
MRYGKVRRRTVKIYVMPVYRADFNGALPLPSDLLARYPVLPIDRDGNPGN